jgi:hypothetical protein
MAVLLLSGISVCHFAVTIATAFDTQYLAVRYLADVERPNTPQTNDSFTFT